MKTPEKLRNFFMIKSLESYIKINMSYAHGKSNYSERIDYILIFYPVGKRQINIVTTL